MTPLIHLKLVKDDQIYLFHFTHGQEEQIKDGLIDLVLDPDLNFDTQDAMAIAYALSRVSLNPKLTVC